MPTLVAAAVAALLSWIVLDDLRRFRIRNLWVVALMLAFPLQCAATGAVDPLLPHALFAAACFVALAGLFAAGAIGGGDAKLLSAALLWVGPEGCFLYALLLLPCTIVYVTGARFAGWPARRMGGRLVIPFGPSIAVAWLAHLALTMVR